MNLAIETHEAIDKIYKKLMPVGEILNSQFSDFEIGMEPEIKLSKNEDGKIAATLISLKYNFKQIEKETITNE